MKSLVTVLILVASLLSACASPTAPTSMSSRPVSLDSPHALTWTPVNLPCNEAVVEFRGWMAIVTNRSSCEHTYTLVIWEYQTETEQRALAHHTITLRPGETGALSVGFAERCGALYQQDVFMDLAPVAPGFVYTLSDVANAVFWSPGALREGCDQPPAPVIPPNTPLSTECELSAFAQIDPMQINGGVASIRLRLRAGYDNIAVFLVVYGSATPFPIVNGQLTPTFPQTLLYESRFVIRAGPAQTISIAVPPNVAAYQIDAGCVPGPPVLHNRQTYPPWAFLEAALGNN